jgi:hypothetical protein
MMVENRRPLPKKWRVSCNTFEATPRFSREIPLVFTAHRGLTNIYVRPGSGVSSIQLHLRQSEVSYLTQSDSCMP